MKIIDENGAVLTTEPDLEAGYLVEDVEVIHHDAVEGTAPQWHRETAKLPDGSLAIYYRDGKEIGRDMVKVIDVPGVDPQPAWDEEVPVMRYIRYTTEELAQREKEKQEAQQRQDALDKLPQTLETMEQLKAENEALRESFATMESAQTDTDSLVVDQEYRITLLELGVTENE